MGLGLEISLWAVAAFCLLTAGYLAGHHARGVEEIGKQEARTEYVLPDLPYTVSEKERFVF